MGRGVMWCAVAAVLVMAGADAAALGEATDSSPAPSTLFATWFEDPTQSMAIQWLAEGVPLPTVDGAAEPYAHPLPRIDDVEIDGQSEDWTEQGLALTRLYGKAGATHDPEQFDVQARLGWNEQGLLLWSEVTASDLQEAEDELLWRGDSIELFVSTGLGEPKRVQLQVAPGVTPEHEAPRYRVVTMNGGEVEVRKDVEVDVASARTGAGYEVELLLPWSAIAVEPEVGREIGLQLYVRDLRDGRSHLVLWHGRDDSHENEHSFERATLAGPGEAAVHGQAYGHSEAPADEDIEGPAVRVFLNPTLAGKSAEVVAGERVLGEAVLPEGQRVSRTWISIERAPQGQSWGEMIVRVDDQTVARVSTAGMITHGPPAAGVVRHRPDAGQGAWREVETAIHRFGDSMYFVHRAEIMDLEPDTAYEMRVNEAEESLRFRTAPVELEDRLTFIEGGDIGVSENVPPLHDRAADYEPLFAVVGGDLAYANGRDVERWVTYLEMWREHMVADDQRIIPMIACIGNHELRRSGHDLANAPFFYSLFDDLFQDRGYEALDIGNDVSLLLLDTDYTTAVAGEQTQWLDQALVARRERTFVLPIYHVPAYPSHRSFEGAISAAIREHWAPLFEQHQVPVAFEHHDHAYKRTHPLVNGELQADGVVYIGDGAWGVGPRPVRPERPYLAQAMSRRHFLVVTLTDEGQIDVRAEGLDGETLDEVSLHARDDADH